jgi:hypothetical protein
LFRTKHLNFPSTGRFNLRARQLMKMRRCKAVPEVIIVNTSIYLNVTASFINWNCSWLVHSALSLSILFLCEHYQTMRVSLKEQCMPHSMVMAPLLHNSVLPRSREWGWFWFGCNPHSLVPAVTSGLGERVPQQWNYGQQWEQGRGNIDYRYSIDVTRQNCVPHKWTLKTEEQRLSLQDASIAWNLIQ